MPHFSASSQSFPDLTKLLVNLRSGLSQFGFSEIQNLLHGSRDRDFNKRATQKSRLVQNAITEIQKKCIDLTYFPDDRQIRFLLWKRISRAIRTKSSAEWNAEKIGQYIVAELRAPDEERLICIPLFNSVTPLSKEPKLHRLAHGVWLIEPSHFVDRLILQLNALLGDIPSEIEAELRRIDDPSSSEFGALLSEPLVACRTTRFSSQREHSLWRYGLPLIALHNIVAVNNLDTSDNLGLLYYTMKLAPPEWSAELRREWESATDDPIFVENGFTEPHEIVSIADASRRVWSYDFYMKERSISAVQWSSEVLANRPPLLILPSLLDESITEKLIKYGLQIHQGAGTDLDARLAHATFMWTKASAYMQEWGWEGAFEEKDWAPDLVDPDFLILYSTIVLESLFSSESDKQEIASRLADLTAGLIGRSGNDRYALSKRIKGAYGLRSHFVHGSVRRPAAYSEKAAWLFKIVTLALWEVVRFRIALEPPFSNWTEFIEYVQRRKFGAER